MIASDDRYFESILLDGSNTMRDLYKRQLGEILVAQGVINKAQLAEALEEQKVRGNERLGKVMVDLGMASEEKVTEARSVQLDVSYVNLQEHKFDPEIISLVSEGLARKYKLIPAKKSGDKLIIVMSNPMDVEATELVQLETKLRVEPALGTEWRILEAIERHYGSFGTEDLQDTMEQAASDIDVAFTGTPEETEVDLDDINEVKRQVSRAPIVRMVNLLLTQAVRKKASDIHIEPRRSVVDVRMRLDGDLHVVRRIPKTLHPAISSRIKIMAELDIAERRLPQDGRISVKIDGRNIDVRVSTSPTLYGERVVLRVLDSMGSLIPLERLGFTGKELQIFRTLISRPQGIVLVTGPTGSGKTTTLYAALNTLKSERINIMTVEDPVEFILDGVNQTNVHHKIGLTFANQLRAILRQDPDIVLVGEIRDAETADVAFRAALTGHLVLSTLHCNDAPSAISRLLDMEVEPFLVSSAINGVVAQRLVRVLCPDCKEAYTPTEDIKLLLGLDPKADVTFYRAVGCGNCDGTGYKGRTGIRETMMMTTEVRQLTLDRVPADMIRDSALAAGMIAMKQDGSAKVVEGITTFEEIQRKIYLEPETIPEIQLKAA